MNEEVKKLIGEAKNICLISSDNEPEAMTSTLALFYTLRELGKNVNLIQDSLPENLNFLLPSVDFLSAPKNFVISIPRSIADITQVYYEKTDENLKIHLTTDKGNLKKEDISFYFQEAKPNLIITLGIKDFKSYLDKNLDSFGFLLGSSILNIDNSPENLKFGQENLLGEKSLSETTLNLINHLGDDLVKQDVANCILTGLLAYYKNFKSEKTTSDIFKLSADLIEKGADYPKIVNNFPEQGERELKFEKIILA